VADDGDAEDHTYCDERDAAAATEQLRPGHEDAPNAGEEACPQLLGDIPEHWRKRRSCPLQSSQTMLMSRRPAAQLCVDSDPGGWVDVQRQRKPIAEQSPA